MKRNRLLIYHVLPRSPCLRSDMLHPPIICYFPGQKEKEKRKNPGKTGKENLPTPPPHNTKRHDDPWQVARSSRCPLLSLIETPSADKQEKLRK